MLITSAIPETWSECNACFIPLGCYFHQIVLVQTVLNNGKKIRFLSGTGLLLYYQWRYASDM